MLRYLSVQHSLDCLGFSRVGDFHHLHFLPALIGTVHLEDVRISIDHFRHGAKFHFSSDRTRVLSLLRDGVLIAGTTFHHMERRGHGIHPGGGVFLALIVVAGDADSLKRLAHHVAGTFLLQETPAENHLLLTGPRRLHGRLIRFHPGFRLRIPLSLHARQLLVRFAGGGLFLELLHHRLHIHLWLFFGHRQRSRHH
jgi:hypothetical protein